MKIFIDFEEICEENRQNKLDERALPTREVLKRLYIENDQPK